MNDKPETRLVEHVVGYEVDAQKILEAFGVSPSRGVTSLNLKVVGENFVELTVQRYITLAELEQLYAALAQEPKPVLVEVTSVHNLDYGI